MSSLNEILSINHHSASQLLGVELAKNDYRLLRDLIRLRKEQGLKQGELAEQMGVSQPTVSAFESMESDPKLSTVRRYAKALGVLVSHTVKIADDACTAPAADGFTRTTWSHKPQMSFSTHVTRVASFAVQAPTEATRTEFALSA